MPWTPEDVFTTDADAIDVAKELVKEYQFTLKDISTPITIRLYRVFGAEGIHFTQSHFIHTPVQAGKYATSRPWNDDLGAALHQVVSGITQYYNQAVKKGHAPDEAWLIPNERF